MGGIARILCKNSIYSYICIYICIYRERLTLSIMDIDRQHWKSCRHTVKICQLSHNRLIDNIGDYLFVLQESENEWELQIWNWSTSVQPAIAPLFIISFQCFKKKKKKVFKNWQVYDWRTKWLIMLGYMDLRRPRVYRRSNVGLVIHKITWFSNCKLNLLSSWRVTFLQLSWYQAKVIKFDKWHSRSEKVFEFYHFISKSQESLGIIVQRCSMWYIPLKHGLPLAHCFYTSFSQIF